MEMRVAAGDPLSYPAPALVVGCFEEGPDAPLAAGLDAALEGCLSALYREGELTGRVNRTVVVHTLGRVAPQRLVFVGLGRRRELTPDRMRQAAGAAVQALRGTRVKGFASALHLAAGGGNEWLRAAAEGHLLGGYAFDRYKSDGEKNGAAADVTLLVPDAATLETAEPAVAEAVAVCEAAIMARDLVSQPGNVATPAFLAEKAVEVAGRYGIDCRVMEREEMERNGMEALLSVAKGSSQPPRLVILEYRGGGEKERPVALVGKGITFDSGGISLKPREGMEKMKNDMAGGAAVLGAVTAAARLALPVNIVGLVPLTGACIVALGNVATGVMGNDEGLVRALRRAGEATGERLWELPVWDEYGELMRSDIADLKNAGGPTAGTVSAGWFLKQFAGNARWAHLDIAGTAWEEKGRPYLPKGATGVGVRLLVEYLRGVARSK